MVYRLTKGERISLSAWLGKCEGRSWCLLKYLVYHINPYAADG